jgi:MFS family permease
MATVPASQQAREDAGLWAPAYRALTIGLVLTTTLIASEALSVVTIMPRVARELGGLNLYGWVFSAFMLGSVIGTVAAGRAADRAGPARPYIAGLLLFSVGLVLAGLAPSMSVLVLARVVQGAGAGAVPAIAYVVIGRTLPERLRARMLALLSSAWVLPGLIGPGLSAEVTQLVGWRWVFLGLLPLVAIAGLLVARALRTRASPAPTPERVAGVEEHRLRDAIRAAVGAALLLAGLSSRSAPIALALICLALIVGLPALRRLLPRGTLLARRGLPVVVLSRGLLTFAFFGADAFVALAVTTALHHSTALAGVVITCSTLAWTAGSWLQVRLCRRTQERSLISAGLVLLLAGIAGMIVSLRPGVGVGACLLAWSLAGFGMGLAYSPISLMTMREAPAGGAGWASAALTLSDVLGTALGAGVGGAALVAGTHRGWSLSSALTAVFVIAAAGAVLALCVARRLPLTPRPPSRGHRGVRADQDSRASAPELSTPLRV